MDLFGINLKLPQHVGANAIIPIVGATPIIYDEFNTAGNQTLNAKTPLPLNNGNTWLTPAAVGVGSWEDNIYNDNTNEHAESNGGSKLAEVAVASIDIASAVQKVQGRYTTPASTANQRGIGQVLRRQDHTNFYCSFVDHSTTNKRFRLFKVKTATINVIATAPAWTWAGNDSVTMYATASGTTITAVFDPESETTEPNTTLSATSQTDFQTETEAGFLVHDTEDKNDTYTDYIRIWNQV